MGDTRVAWAALQPAWGWQIGKDRCRNEQALEDIDCGMMPMAHRNYLALTDDALITRS